MKVTIIGTERCPVPPVLGGAIEQMLFATATAIRNPELTVISAWSDALEGLKPSDTFYHVDIGMQAARAKRVLGNRLPPGLREGVPARRFHYLNGATDLLLEIDPDIIEIHNRPEFVPYLARQFPAKRLILYMHSLRPPTHISPDDMVRNIDHLVFVSRYLARQFISCYPESKSKATIIYNSVDTDRWHPGLKNGEETEKICRAHGLFPGRTVLFVGRTVYQKGISCLIEAMDIVRRRLHGAKLVVVGSPFFGAVRSSPFLTKLKKRASQLGDTVTFTGHIDHSRTAHFFAAADVTVAPSVGREAFGNVIIESMATGVPVIGSRCGGIPEIIDDGIDGLLVDDPRNVTSLARHIVALLEDSERRRKIGAAARRKAVDHFSSPIRLRSLRAFYRSLKNA